MYAGRNKWSENTLAKYFPTNNKESFCISFSKVKLNFPTMWFLFFYFYFEACGLVESWRNHIQWKIISSLIFLSAAVVMLLVMVVARVSQSSTSTAQWGNNLKKKQILIFIQLVEDHVDLAFFVAYNKFASFYCRLNLLSNLLIVHSFNCILIKRVKEMKVYIICRIRPNL